MVRSEKCKTALRRKEKKRKKKNPHREPLESATSPFPTSLTSQPGLGLVLG